MAKAVNPSTTSLEISDGAVTSTTTVKDEKSAGVNYSQPEKSLVSASYNVYVGDEDPTEDELHGPNALRRISAPIPWAVYTVAFVELCERFSYYGTQVLCK
jgi:POT family proton-dependent oligopeptide transporter